MDLTDVMQSVPPGEWGSPYRRAALDELDQRLAAARALDEQYASSATGPLPTPSDERSGNILRPQWLDEVVGQIEARTYLWQRISTAIRRGRPLGHTLLVGAAGTGKTTLAHVIGNELGVDVYALQAPISFDTLLELREVMQDGDVLFLDEIHLQAIQERRGTAAATKPEVLYNVMEDRTIITASGVLPFPAITMIGGTTDEGMLPDPFLDRFPIRPELVPYTEDELATIAERNAVALTEENPGFGLDSDAPLIFARAARETPRMVNNYVKAANDITEGIVDADLATYVVRKGFRTTLDGLTSDQQKTLLFLFERCKRTVGKKGERETRYQASVSTIATAIGKSRDQKAIQLRVEPYLIRRGFLQVGHGGRLLTPAGVKRARELQNEVNQ